MKIVFGENNEEQEQFMMKEDHNGASPADGPKKAGLRIYKIHIAYIG